MTARHREPTPPAQARLRALVVVLVLIFFISFFFLRGSGTPDTNETTIPQAGETTTTAAGGTGSTTSSGDTTTTTAGDSTETTNNLAPLQSVVAQKIGEGFDQGTVVTAPAGDDRLFITERIGVIKILHPDGETSLFLDLTDRVLAGGIEQGLLGLVFHPDYANNGRFFVYYTDKGGRRQLSEFHVSVSDPDLASPDTEKVLIELEQPPNSVDIRHYAGQLNFGPDGYLWFSMGDGADSRAQAQDPNTLFGTVDRIDVNSGDPYSIPPDNPFVDGGGAPEVWAYGLRNPWRFSIDATDGLIYIADVGHAEQEEVDVLPIDQGGGYNLGWSDMEGTRCFHKQDCDPADYTSPTITYSHDEGCAITGGYVYRGSEIPELTGTYFYSDWCSEWIRSFDYVDGQVTNEKDWSDELGQLGQINSFGLGGDGELYFVTYDGQVAKIVAER
ncbi:MAG: PQQ-dependent sugar dehydrogenase [Acidimicrobiia bacterium]